MCGNFILTESANRVYFFYLLNLRNLLYLIYYPHYAVIIFPIVIYPLCVAVEHLESYGSNNFLAIILLCCAFVFPTFYPLLQRPWHRNIELPEQTKTICKIIEEKTDKEDNISVYGNWDAIYVLTDHKHATRYSYQYPIAEVSKMILDDYFTQLHSELPKIIVVQSGHNDERILAFLKDNHYSLYWSENDDKNGTSVYELIQRK